jgi:hypothetical protein
MDIESTTTTTATTTAAATTETLLMQSGVLWKDIVLYNAIIVSFLVIVEAVVPGAISIPLNKLGKALIALFGFVGTVCARYSGRVLMAGAVLLSGVAAVASSPFAAALQFGKEANKKSPILTRVGIWCIVFLGTCLFMPGEVGLLAWTHNVRSHPVLFSMIFSALLFQAGNILFLVWNHKVPSMSLESIPCRTLYLSVYEEDEEDVDDDPNFRNIGQGQEEEEREPEDDDDIQEHEDQEQENNGGNRDDDDGDVQDWGTDSVVETDGGGGSDIDGSAKSDQDEEEEQGQEEDSVFGMDNGPDHEAEVQSFDDGQHSFTPIDMEQGGKNRKEEEEEGIKWTTCFLFGVAYVLTCHGFYLLIVA